MQQRLNIIWLVLFILTGVFCGIYFWFALFPGGVPAEASRYFDVQQITQARDYHYPLRLSYICNFVIQALVLAWFVFGRGGGLLIRWAKRLMGGNYSLSALGFLGFLWLLLQIINVPFSYFNGYYWNHLWGFSTQSLASWGIDLLKSGALNFTMYGLGFLILLGIINRWPRCWWLITSFLFSLWLVIQTFLWPVAVSPWFNEFAPVRDPQITAMVMAISDKADLVVEEILVMDASKRTTMANAYFTGLGTTKRIVLYDTLLENYPLAEIKMVVAHEIAHWKEGHIVKGLLAGMLGTFLLWGILNFLLPRKAFMTPYPPESIAVILLFSLLIFFVGSPLQNYISRGMEKEADRVAIELTGDPQAAVQLQVDLAVKNMSDVAPAPFIRWFGYSHPPALERIKAAEKTFPK